MWSKGLFTKDETVKMTQNSKRMTIWSLISGSAFNWVFWWFTKCLSTEITKFWSTRNPECKKTDKQIPYNRLWSLILCGWPYTKIYKVIYLSGLRKFGRTPAAGDMNGGQPGRRKESFFEIIFKLYLSYYRTNFCS